MTFTVLMIVYRNSSMAPDQFKDHYENVHIPLMKSIAGPSFPLTHTRRYIQRNDKEEGRHQAAVLTGTQLDFEFDCLSELKFEDETGYEEISALLASPEVAPKVGKDCAQFMDVARTKTVVLGEIVETRRES